MELKHEPLPKNWREKLNNKDQKWMKHLIGHKIHTWSFRGIYTVKRVSKNKLCITCNRWKEREEWIDNSSFIKIAGGINSFKS